jgi:hypothetical protein
MNLNDRFETLDDNLKLDPAERARAVTAHNHLTAVLVADRVAKRTRLQGSFARKTMLPPAPRHRQGRRARRRPARPPHRAQRPGQGHRPDP